MFIELIKPYLAREYTCTTEGVRHHIQKEKRIIDTLEPLMNSHRLVIDDLLIKEDFKNEPDHQLFRQMTRLTRDRGSLRHDDAIDALAICANYWIERLDRDQQLSYNQHKEELLDQELEKFMENAIGRTQEKDRWI